MWMGCIFFAVKALGFPSVVHMVLCLLLYTLVASALHRHSARGGSPPRCRCGFCSACRCCITSWWRIPRSWAGPCMTGCGGVGALLHGGAFVCVPGHAAASAGTGGVCRRFGDRNDGRRLRTLSPIFAVSPYIMKTRNTSQNFITDQIEVSNTERYILEKRRAGMKNFGILHVLLAAYVRTCARYPGLQSLHCRPEDLHPGPGDRDQHDGEKEMSTDSRTPSSR